MAYATSSKLDERKFAQFGTTKKATQLLRCGTSLSLSPSHKRTPSDLSHSSSYSVILADKLPFSLSNLINDSISRYEEVDIEKGRASLIPWRYDTEEGAARIHGMIENQAFSEIDKGISAY